MSQLQYHWWFWKTGRRGLSHTEAGLSEQEANVVCKVLPQAIEASEQPTLRAPVKFSNLRTGP